MTFVNPAILQSVIRATMVQFHTKFTLVNNAHLQICRTVRTEDGIAAVEQSIERDDPPLGATTGAVPIHLVCLPVLQNPTRVRIEADRPTLASHVR